MQNKAGDSGIDVELHSVTMFYGKVRAVDGFSLKVRQGSFTTLLGPSGCGKTTLLRIIAGFFEPHKGEVFIAGLNQRGIPPEQRSTGIVFQDYALFPHMTARENLAYGLKVRKADAETVKQEVRGAAGSLGIEELLDRYPGELSGGQQQRLALGRALILKPRILLMDEPVSSLDAKLRARVREELRDIQRRLGITTIYVTHDQEEALSLSDYIAVMNNGRLEQAGTPGELYNFPSSAFTADFTGAANFMRLEGKNCLVRPEWIELAEPRSEPLGPLEFEGSVISADYLGRVTRVRVLPDTGEVLAADVPSPLPQGPGEEGRGVFKAPRRVRFIIKHKWELPGKPV
ncbi:MAG: ABC transporter ATP-binding protein [Treponema sp.]|jgi:ABC-type Fe3+/spermidine/putrescine transport system ATPase subunit|nr:ABC transporter ATP-binding protein [Treponema sp.]